MAKVGKKKKKTEQYMEIESKENSNCVKVDVVISIIC